jgi:hypothetical protein
MGRSAGRCFRILGVAGSVISLSLAAESPPVHAAPGTVQFSAATYSVNEADGTVTLELTRTGGTAAS